MLWVCCIAAVAVGYSKNTSQVIILGAKSESMVVLDINSQYFTTTDTIVDVIKKRFVLNDRLVPINKPIERRLAYPKDCKYCNSFMTSEIADGGGIMIYQFGTCDKVWYIDPSFKNIVSIGYDFAKQVILIPTFKVPFLAEFEKGSYMTPNCLFEFKKDKNDDNEKGFKLGEISNVDVAKYMKTASNYGYSLDMVEAIAFYSQMEDTHLELWGLFVIEGTATGKEVGAVVFQET